MASSSSRELSVKSRLISVFKAVLFAKIAPHSQTIRTNCLRRPLHISICALEGCKLPACWFLDPIEHRCFLNKTRAIRRVDNKIHAILT